MKDDTITLTLIGQACAKIFAYVKGLSSEQFIANDEKQSAVIMQSIVIGELAKHVSSAARIPIDVPWKRSAGLRDVAVHQYFGLKMEEIWRMIERDIPELQQKIFAHLK